MEVLLLKTIGKFKAGINKVANGFGRYLINNKKALSCSPENIAFFNANQEIYKKEQEMFDSTVKDLCQKIDNKFIFIVSPVNETGNLYGSIQPKQLVEEIKKQLENSPMITNSIIIANKILKPGIFTVLLQFNKEHVAKINIVIGNNDNVIKEMYLTHITPEKADTSIPKIKNKKVVEIHSENAEETAPKSEVADEKDGE
jgi:large subunit ribosomal protein L9